MSLSDQILLCEGLIEPSILDSLPEILKPISLCLVSYLQFEVVLWYLEDLGDCTSGVKETIVIALWS